MVLGLVHGILNRRDTAQREVHKLPHGLSQGIPIRLDTARKVVHRMLQGLSQGHPNRPDTVRGVMQRLKLLGPTLPKEGLNRSNVKARNTRTDTMPWPGVTPQGYTEMIGMPGWHMSITLPRYTGCSYLGKWPRSSWPITASKNGNTNMIRIPPVEKGRERSKGVQCIEGGQKPMSRTLQARYEPLDRGKSGTTPSGP